MDDIDENRFSYDKPMVAFSKGGINDNVSGVTYEFTMDTVLDLLNSLVEENEQLKKREEQLLSEIEDFQQLLTRNDNICYKRVIDVIDTRIKNGEEAIEWGKDMNADYGAMGFHIEMLKKLKKELQE